MLRDKTARTWFIHLLLHSGEETERVYSYNHGICTGRIRLLLVCDTVIHGQLVLQYPHSVGVEI